MHCRSAICNKHFFLPYYLPDLYMVTVAMGKMLQENEAPSMVVASSLILDSRLTS